jgi:hypothetical protein
MSNTANESKYNYDIDEERLRNGIELRYAAQYGDDNFIKKIVEKKGNACSADSFGLTPLMYACWNGHIDCVKYLLCNPGGVDINGVRRSTLNQQSCKGYTALHLTAMDTPLWSVKIIIKLLLMYEIDRNIKDNDGLTAYEIAQKYNYKDALDAFNEYDNREQNLKELAELAEIKRLMEVKYTFHHFEPNEREVKFDWKNKPKFPVPKYIFNKERVGYLPTGMLIHEHQIKPLIDTGFNEYEGVDALKCLDFSHKQAAINTLRRERILLHQDKSWEPINIENELNKRPPPVSSRHRNKKK